MRGALQATLAAFRAYRRSSESRRQAAADATWARLAKRNWTAIGAHANGEPNGAQPGGAAAKSRVRRSVIAFGAPVALVATGIVAIFLGISELNQRGQQPGLPYGTADPRAAAPAASMDAAPAAGGTIAPTSVTPLPGASVPIGSVTRAAGLPAVTGSPSGAAASAQPVTPAASATTAAPAASASPGLLVLCREVVAAGNGWPSVLKGTDRATVIAAAGSKKNVLSYCTNLVDSSSAQ